MNDIEMMVSLNAVRGIGMTIFSRLLRRFRTVRNIFETARSELLGINGIGAQLADEIIRSREKKYGIVECRTAAENGIDIIPYYSPLFPEPLRYIYDRPLLIYKKGTLSQNDYNGIAVIGSRNCSYYGRKNADRFSNMLAKAGITVISGMARGIDTAAHHGALRNNGRTIAILGSGLLNIYPRENLALAGRIADNGAVISEMPLNAPPDPRNFPRRNRIVSALSRGILVIEADTYSGAMLTVEWGLDQGREIFAVPGNIDSHGSKGCHKLIKMGAKLTEGLNDILEELNFDTDVNTAAAPRGNKKATCKYSLDEVELKILHEVKNGATDIDTIIRNTGAEIRDITPRLVFLEMKGLIKILPGNNIADAQKL